MNPWCRGLFYRLDDEKNAVEYTSLEEYIKARFQDHVVSQTQIGDVRVSTVFLGINHAYLPGATPLLFETMVFGGEMDHWQWRYSTWDEAAKGHVKAVALVAKEKGEE